MRNGDLMTSFGSIDLFEEVTKSQASGWVEAEDYKMPPCTGIRITMYRD